MTKEEVLQQLPYTTPFLFVDDLQRIDADRVVGKYTFRSDAAFYEGHFKDFPVTPGVLLTECCAQIGLVCLGIYLMGAQVEGKPQIAMSNSEMDFLHPVYPGETVTVIGEKVYFRFQKLKCKVKMFTADNTLVCRGAISGMLKPSGYEN